MMTDDRQVSATDRLIVALDVDTPEQAREIVRELDGVVSFFKVGYQLFVATGQGFVRELAEAGKSIFFDLKINDVAETVKLAVGNLPGREEVRFLTLQGPAATVRAAVEGRGGRRGPKFLHVPLLSSIGEADLREMSLIGEGSGLSAVQDYIIAQAGPALDAGADGVIASGAAIGLLRSAFPGRDCCIVSPGIRPAGTAKNEHKRSATPADAIAAGADYLVVGRPIRDAKDRAQAAQSIIEEITTALAPDV